MSEKIKDKKMKRYLTVYELEDVESYSDIHRNIHKNKWKEIPEICKKAGAEEMILWINGNEAIVYYECEDIDKLHDNLSKFSLIEKWNETVFPMFVQSPKIYEVEHTQSCEKIFDMKQQLKGELKQD